MVKPPLKGGFFVSGNMTLCFLPPLYYKRLQHHTHEPEWNGVYFVTSPRKAVGSVGFNFLPLVCIQNFISTWGCEQHFCASATGFLCQKEYWYFSFCCGNITVLGWISLKGLFQEGNEWLMD